MSRFSVSGMTCGHCVGAVTRAVRSVDPAAAVEVELATGKVSVHSAADDAAIAAAIEAEGYRVAVADAA